MMKMHLLLLLSILINFNIYCQNPEGIEFWSILEENMILDDQKSEFISEMGVSETPTGKYLFLFTKDSIKFFSNGFIGSNYNEKIIYKDIERKMLYSDKNSGIYIYKGFSNGKEVNFLVETKFKNEGGLNAVITMKFNQVKLIIDKGEYKTFFSNAVRFTCISK